VDETLQLKIKDLLLDTPEKNIGTIVLCTGDGGVSEIGGGGFVRVVAQALARGWFVEIVCWSGTGACIWDQWNNSLLSLRLLGKDISISDITKWRN